MASQDTSTPAGTRPGLRPAGTIGAGLFALWGILHLWVGYEGTRLYIFSPAQDQWRMFIGGTRAPFDAFRFPADPVTAHVQANLILNFCFDVAGYGCWGSWCRGCCSGGRRGRPT